MSTNIRIKQLGDKTATAGVHFGGALERRKLEPGEIVAIPDKESALLDALLDGGLVEITRDKPTRPLAYASVREARLCSPSFKPHDPSEEAERDRAVAAVKKRGFGMTQAEPPADPVEDETAEPEADLIEGVEPDLTAAPVKKATRKRRGRRAAEG